MTFKNAVIIIIGTVSLVLLFGKSNVSPQVTTESSKYSNKTIEEFCIGGVEYFWIAYYKGALTPKWRPDGTIKECGENEE